MALLAKYYLQHSGPMGMEHDFDVRRKTYHADGTWRPPLVPMHNNGPTSAPNSPRLHRKGTWHVGSRSSGDSGESAPANTKTRPAPVRLSSPFQVRRVSGNGGGGGGATGACASAPTSPHFGIHNSDSNTKLSSHGDRPSLSPSHNDTEHSPKQFSPTAKTDGASRRRSRYASLRKKPQNQSFAGVGTGTASEFNISKSAAASPPHSSREDSKKQSSIDTNEDPLTRRRCASGPLNEEQKLKKEPPAHVQTKIPEILVTLSYSNNSSFITATINKVRNLPENSNAFVRVHLYEGFKPISLKQTSVFVAGGSETEFKQAFMFSLGKDSLWATHILVELFEYNSESGCECKYGDLVIGPKAGGNGFSQWRQVCTHPNIPCGMWHIII